jgi:hypothetical protein
VERVPADRHEFRQALKTPLAAWDLQNGLRYQTESAESRNKRKIQGLKGLVERNVEEGELWVRFLSPVGRSHGWPGL